MIAALVDFECPLVTDDRPRHNDGRSLNGQFRVAHGSNQERLRLFENPVLEWLSRDSPVTLMAFWLPAACAALGAGLWLGIDPVAAAGWTVVTVLVWSLFEYVAHRFLYHARLRSGWGKRLIFITHGCHHADPDDPMRNVMPLSVSIPTGLMLFGLDCLLLQPPERFWTAGVFALSYAAYDVTHWRAHQRAGRSAIARYLRRHHMRHHYGREGTNFGVSSPLWDIVFGTFASSDRTESGG